MARTRKTDERRKLLREFVERGRFDRGRKKSKRSSLRVIQTGGFESLQGSEK